ncbi:hypothetical protein NPIL_111351, partial [Nephila pilipes]
MPDERPETSRDSSCSPTATPLSSVQAGTTSSSILLNQTPKRGNQTK